MLNNIFRTALKNNRGDDYVFSSAKWVTLLMVIGILLYPLTSGWGTLVSLCLALGLLIGRYLIAKQAAGDFRDMHHAKKAYSQSRNKDYLRFIKARSEQMLNDNKVLTKTAKREINELLTYAEGRL
ncbi:MAG: hypothetical protein ACE3JK_00050 [Sporolactobacillus sp.]